ncbi:MAG: 2-amino-4-hydroxy-6-hydroxymethyldihydropteridine diphosphokinase [Gammaproteobacteria bacterium]
MPDVRAYIGVGSNIDPERHIPVALRGLRSAFDKIDMSPAYRSPPLGFEGADFINCVVGIDCDLDTAALIEKLKALEASAGRQTRAATGSRELDLDLLLYGEQVIHIEGTILPRPDVLEYAFVLRPLAELAPAFTHPETGRTLAWHWENFTGEAVALTPVALNSVGSGP